MLGLRNESFFGIAIRLSIAKVREVIETDAMLIIDIDVL